MYILAVLWPFGSRKDGPEGADQRDIVYFAARSSEGGICQEIFHRYFIILFYFFWGRIFLSPLDTYAYNLLIIFFNWTSRLAISYLSTEIPAVGACARFRNNYAIFCSMLYLMNHWYCPGLVGRQVEGGWTCRHPCLSPSNNCWNPSTRISPCYLPELDLTGQLKDQSFSIQGFVQIYFKPAVVRGRSIPPTIEWIPLLAILWFSKAIFQC